MESVLYNIIEYGADPCRMKLVSSYWRDKIDEIDGLIIQRVQWRIPDQSLSYIVMMLIDAYDIIMAEKMIMHMSIPIVDWNIISYLIENRTIGYMIYNRIKNRHIMEMSRRLGLVVSIPCKEIFKISSVIGGQNSTAGLKSISSIISSGYLDAMKILIEQAEIENVASISIEQLLTLVNCSLAMLIQNEVPINPCIIQWLYRSSSYTDCIPDEIYGMLDAGSSDRYHKEHIMMRISLDIPHDRIKLIPTNVLHQLGKNVLLQMTQSIFMCKNYIAACTDRKGSFAMNIRVIDAIIRHCKSTIVRDMAIDIAINNGWDKYLVICNE